MAGDKSPKRKRFPSPAPHVQRLLSFGIYAASFELPEEERTAEMTRLLEWLIGGLHSARIAAPNWLLRPYWYFRRKSTARRPEHRTGPPAHLMRRLLDGLVEHLPPYDRWEAIQRKLDLFRSIYAERDVPPPEWLREALAEFEVE